MAKSTFEFNEELYDFLLENEVSSMYEIKGRLGFGVHVHFIEIPEFIEIVGEYILDDGGIDLNLNNRYTVYIPLEDIFMNSNYSIMEYKECFDEYDIKRYKESIEKFDRGEV